MDLSYIADLMIKILGIRKEEITGIEALKKGMTNRSFLVTCSHGKYIVRIPGEGTAQLINREREAAVYHTIAGRRIGDDIVYIDSINGYKITRYFEGARCCDALRSDDTARCMRKLRAFHDLELTVDHEFDIFGQIAFYESLWDGMLSGHEDYLQTKEQTLSLRPYIESHIEKKVLTHIDAVPDNFLFIDNGVEEEIRLIDWEYAGMQDPHVDIAMFCVYSFYDRQQVDRLIQAYFTEGCSKEIRIKIYCYISVCGLLWSNWCEYKHKLGVAFGQYALRQYQYAKEYYQIVQDELRKHNE